MKTNLSRSIIKTFIYADIFDYPLRVSEIHKYLISPKKYSKRAIARQLLRLRHIISCNDSLYYLRNKKNLPNIRLLRKKYSLSKIKKAQMISKVLSYIPTIQLIGISGSLAMNNCKKSDDIDFFFITRKNTLWLSRTIIVILLFVFGLKRGRAEKFGTDKICPNMFMSEDSLNLPRHNLFVAHELAQLKILINKNNAYEMLLSSNSWIHRYLANTPLVIGLLKTKKTFNLFSKLLAPVEKTAYAFQLFYMRNHKTREYIGPKIASFHPLDKTPFVLMIFRQKCKFIFKFIDKKGKSSKMKKSSLLKLKSHHNSRFLSDTLGY